MWVMEENKKWGIVSFSSLIDGFEALGDNYGQKSLHFNAAAAMFLLATDEERENWVGMVERARRQHGTSTMLERIRALSGAAPTEPAAAPTLAQNIARGMAGKPPLTAPLEPPQKVPRLNGRERRPQQKGGSAA